MNTIDAIVIGVIAVSTLIAFLRGFVREMLTIGSWIGAALVTLYGFPVLQPRFETWISSKLAADIVGGIGLFLISLIVFSILSHMIAKLVRGSALTAVDRSLGLLFGLVRGAIVVSLAYMLILWLDPAWLEGARTAPAMARGAEILRSWAPAEFANDLPADLRPPSQDKTPGHQAPGQQAPGQQTPGQQTGDDSARKPVYNQRQNDALQRLIDATSRK